MRPRWGRPLFVKKDTNFTHLVADRVTGLDGATYTVLFIGTGRHVHVWAWLMEAYVPETGPCVLWLTPVHSQPPQETAGCSRL